MEKQEQQDVISELAERVGELERLHKRQKLFRWLLIGGFLLYVFGALFAYSKLLSSFSF